MWQKLSNLDRRWLFLLTVFAVGVPLMTGIVLPLRISPMTRDVFQAIEDLPEGSRVLMPLDYDPASEGELQPMANAFVRHCAEKKLKIYILTLWPSGVGMNQRAVKLLKEEYPDYVYGEDYVNLGYRPGLEGVIALIVNDLRGLFSADQEGTPISKIPMMDGVDNIRKMPLIVNVSAGEPGLKQWVQYAATPFDSIKIIGGTTGVQAAPFYPYVPDQMIGMLPGIKPAAEYEILLLDKYPELKNRPNTNMARVFMTSQEVAHFMLIAVVIFGNVVMLFAGGTKARKP